MKRILGISLSAVCPAALALANKTMVNVPLMRVYGEARSIQARRGQVVVMGDFRAVNSETGEEFASAVVYLPQGLHEMIVVGLEEAEAAGVVRFGFDIWAEPDPKGRSYTIGFKDLLEKEGAPDPMAFLANQLPPMEKAAPKK